VSDEFELAKGGGIGAVVTAFIGVLWAAFVRKGEKDSDKVEADREARMVRFESALEKLSERIEGGLGAQRQEIGAVRELAVRTDERVGMSLGREPRTNPAYKLPPELAAAVAKFRDSDK
jgi:hypothetical protein